MKPSTVFIIAVALVMILALAPGGIIATRASQRGDLEAFVSPLKRRETAHDSAAFSAR